MKDKLLQIIKHYGIMPQLKYIHSEYFELDEAIIQAEGQRFEGKHKDIPENCRQHIAEEIADVMVMLQQFQDYYGIPDEEINDFMLYKISRQLERIEKENDK